MMSAFFRKIFGRDEKKLNDPESVVDENPDPIIQQRLQRATESLLENEALTANLDDQAARVLLDWGVALAQQIVAKTIKLDEAAAEEATYQPMRALRKMLRQINDWASSPDEPGLEKILAQAELSYGDGFTTPDSELRAQFFTQLHSGDPAQVIGQLRRFIEN